MDNMSNKQTARIFAEALASSLADALTKAVQVPSRLKVLDTPDLATRHENPVHYRLSANALSSCTSRKLRNSVRRY